MSSDAPETARLVARALAAQPRNGTVAREAAALLAPSDKPVPSPLGGLSRAELVSELRAAELRVAELLKALARSS